MFHEISLSQRKFHAKFCLPKRNFERDFVLRGTKCHAKFRTFARNFNDMGILTKIRFLRNIAQSNFVEIRRNSLSLLLLSAVEFEENFSFEYQQFSDNERNRDQKPSVR